MNKKKLVFFTALASGLEYYDFIVYGLLSTYLATTFFPKHNAFLANLQALFVFSLGYFARPLGGVLFGWLGDHYGRKPSFLLSMLCIAISTLAIGLLPSYQVAGITSSILLILFRTLQGAAFGAELPGITTLLCEHIQTKGKGLAFGFVLSGVSLGGTIGTLFIYILTQALSHTQITQYGWRLPFILGGSLAIANYFLRKKLQESPLFLHYTDNINVPTKSIPLKIVFTTYYKQVILGTLITLFGACYVIFGVTMPTFLHHIYHYKMHEIYSSISLGFICSILLLPIFGHLADKVGRENLLLIASFLMIITSFFLFPLLTKHSSYILIIFVIFYQIIVSALANSYLPMLTELFPITVRLTGVGVCYNMAFLIASLTPAALIIASHVLNSRYKAYFALLILASITIGATIFLIINRKRYIYPIDNTTGANSSTEPLLSGE